MDLVAAQTDYPFTSQRSGRTALAGARIRRALLGLGQREENVPIRHDDDKNGTSTELTY